MMGVIHGSGTLHRPSFGHCFIHEHSAQPVPRVFFKGSAGVDSGESERAGEPHTEQITPAAGEHGRAVLALRCSLSELQGVEVAARSAAASQGAAPNASQSARDTPRDTGGSTDLDVSGGGVAGGRESGAIQCDAEGAPPNETQASLVRLLEALPAPLRQRLSEALDQELVFVVPWHSGTSARRRRHRGATAATQIVMYFDNEGGGGHRVAGSHMLELAGQTVRALCGCAAGSDEAGDRARCASNGGTSSDACARPDRASLPSPPPAIVQSRVADDARAAAVETFRARVTELVARGMTPTEAAAVALRELSVAQ